MDTLMLQEQVNPKGVQNYLKHSNPTLHYNFQKPRFTFEGSQVRREIQ